MSQGMTIRSPDSLVPSVFTREEVVRVDAGEFKLEDDYWYSLVPVGTGVPSDTCGDILFTVAACTNKPGSHRPILIPDSCGRRTCPVCWPGWADRAGDRGEDVLNGYLTARHGAPQKALPGFDRRKVLPRHYSFTPDRWVIEDLVRQAKALTVKPSDFHRNFLRLFRRRCIGVVEAAGGHSGLIVVHEIRLKSDRSTYESDNRADTDRYRAVLDRAGWRKHVKYYPHAHVLVFGRLEIDKCESGWRFHYHRISETPKMAIKYLLSHAPAYPGYKSVAYFGDCNPSRLIKFGEYRHRERFACQECLDEGVEPDLAYRVMARLMPGIVFENDNDRERRLRRGRGPPVRWSFETISERHYVKVHRVGRYRVRVPGEKSIRRTQPEYITRETWEYLYELGLLPGSWFEIAGPPAPRHPGG